MSRVSIQVGSAQVGRILASWGFAVARVRLADVVAWTGIVVGCFMLGCVFALAILVVQGKFSQPAPVSVPAVFCPAGQHPAGAGCAADH